MRKAVQSSAPPAMASAPAEGRRRSGGRRGEEPTPCCSKVGLKRGPWAPEEDELLASYVRREGEGRWRTLPKRAGLQRCGKSCRLRWMNYLRPSIKRGPIAPDEEDLILRLHSLLGNRWSLIAGRIPGRTDNEIKNYWNTHLSKKLIGQGIDPRTHKPFAPSSPLVPLGFEIKLPPQPTPTAPYRTTLSPDSGTTFDDARDNVSSNATPVRSDHFGRFSGGGFNNDEELEFGTTAGDQGAFEGSGGGGGVAVKGSGADEALKSFVDSLINEDFFLQQQNAANRCDHDHNNNYVDVDGAVLGRGGLLEGELASLAELE